MFMLLGNDKLPTFAGLGHVNFYMCQVGACYLRQVGAARLRPSVAVVHRTLTGKVLACCGRLCVETLHLMCALKPCTLCVR